MRLLRSTLLLLLLTAAAARTWTTALVEGYQQDWKFLAKFAFTSTTSIEPGMIYLRAWTFMSGQHVLLYENDMWFAAQEHSAFDLEPEAMGLSRCERQASLAFANASVPQGRFYGDAGRVIVSHVIHPDPSYVFMALARCRAWLDHSKTDSCTGSRPDGTIPNGVFLYFELTMLNPGGYWRAHFSADEFGIFEFHLVLGGGYLLLSLAYAIKGMICWADEPFVHKLQVSIISTPTGPAYLPLTCVCAACRQVFSAVLGCSLAYHAFSLAHYFDYAETGVGRPWAVWVAEGADSLSTVLFTLLLLMVSKGWMVSKSRLKRKTRFLQGIVTILLIITYVVIFVLEIVARDPAATYHKYESSGARVLIVLRLLITGWFAWCVHRSYHHDSRVEVRNFFVCLSMIGGVWLLSLPVFSIVATNLPNYLRLRYVTPACSVERLPALSVTACRSQDLGSPPVSKAGPPWQHVPAELLPCVRSLSCWQGNGDARAHL